MSEIKFYGLKGSVNSNLLKISNENIKSFGIRIPAASALTLGQIYGMTENSFAWPLVMRKNQSFSPPILINSDSEFREAIDDVRDPDETILFSLPPVKSEEGYLAHVYAYMGVDFICVHNYKTDRIIISTVDNSSFFSSAVLDDDKVVRLIPGVNHLYFDSIFDLHDPRLAPIFSKSLDTPEKISEFVSGYKSGYMINEATNHRPICRFNDNTFIGDPQTLGYMVGSRMRHRINRLVKAYSTSFNLSELDLFRIRAALSIENFNDVMRLFSIHNKICAGDMEAVSSKDLNFIMNKYCTGVIPDTFIACGEGGNYCSESCMKYSKVGASTLTNVLSLAALLDVSSNPTEILDPSFNIPQSIPDLKVDTIWKSDMNQFRIVGESSDSLSIRFQARNVEVTSRLIGEIDTFNILAWKESSNIEWDIHLDTDNTEINEKEFKNWKSQLKSIDYCNKSNYSGSSASYAPLTFQKDVGFLSGNLTVIPIKRFISFLESKGIKKNLNLED